MSIAARETACIADDVEARAFVDLYDAAPVALKAQLGLEVRTAADTTLLFAFRVADPMFNRVIGLGLRRDATSEEVQEIVRAYLRAGVGVWWLHWNALARPADMPDRLLAAGFTYPRRRSWAKMLRGTAPPPALPTDLEIEPVRDAQAHDTIEAIVASYGMPGFMVGWIRQLHGRPGWTLYGVSDRGRVVGGGALFLEGGQAWLGLGGVLPTHRRRGGQGALMARRIADAIARGATHIVTETGEPIADEPNPSLGNMHRCGFERVASRLNLAGPPAQ
jgi:hypothetical protein